MTPSLYQIKMATPNEAQMVSELIHQGVDMLEDKSYTPAQLAAWKKINTPEAIAESLQQRRIFCAFEGDELVGTVGLEGNELVGLYIKPSRKQQGIGGMLLVHLEQYAAAHQIPELKLTSIPSAKAYYQHKGFHISREVLTVVDGVEFPETEMVKRLTTP
ncbi:MAG: GNAT family N-acetyltransferase [Bacteroidota bacterium]